MRISAESDLAWWYTQWGGAAGIRSTDHGAVGLGGGSHDAAEDQIIRALPDAHRARLIARRLAALNAETGMILSLSYCQPRMVEGIDGSALASQAARELVARCHEAAATRALKAAEKAKDEATKAKLDREGGHEMQRAAEARVTRILARALLDDPNRRLGALRVCTPEEVEVVRRATDTRLLEAHRAYERAEPVEQISMRTQR